MVDDTRRAVLSVADVELPDGTTFEQYVLRVPPAAIVVVLDDADRVLMMWRTLDQPNTVYIARGVDRTGALPDVNEAETIEWIPLSRIRQYIDDGVIVGAGSVTGLLAVLLAKAEGRL